MSSYRFKPFLIESTLLLPGKFALGFVLVMLELHFFTPSINLNTRQGAIGDVVVVGIVGVVVAVVLVMLVLSFLNALNESITRENVDSRRRGRGCCQLFKCSQG